MGEERPAGAYRFNSAEATGNRATHICTSPLQPLYHCGERNWVPRTLTHILCSLAVLVKNSFQEGPESHVFGGVTP